VLHCPYCHGHEVRDRQLGVIGGSPSAVRYAQIVRQWTHDLVYFTPSDVLPAAERAGLVARAIGVVDPRVQVITAAGAGSAAAIAVNADLVEDDVDIVVRDFKKRLLTSPTDTTLWRSDL